MQYEIYRKSNPGDVSKKSMVKYIHTRRRKESDSYVNLYVKGTGRNNFDNAIVRYNNDIYLSNDSKYQGLQLLVIKRRNMQLIYRMFFDTFNSAPNKQFQSTFLQYSYNEDGSIKTETVNKIITKTGNYDAANDLYYRLSKLDNTVFLVLVSCFGWERYFTVELVDLLAKFGALNILEFKQFFSTRKTQQINKDESLFQEDSVLKKHNNYHPFAFVSIPWLGPARGFESIRTNKGNYLSVKNIPQAELLIRIKYNPYSRIYNFDQEQYHKRFSYSDDYKDLFNAPDYSLRNVLPLLLYSNTTSDYNLGFDIFDPNTNLDYPQNKQNKTLNQKFQTELDRVVLGDNVYALRRDSSGAVYQDGIDISTKDFFAYYNATAYYGLECKWPYNINSAECADISKLPMANDFFRCKIGASPQLCSQNLTDSTYFPGYDT
jgi:hypothetical protein